MKGSKSSWFSNMMACLEETKNSRLRGIGINKDITLVHI